tara:strand:+ start:4260 stop:4376 length:117 start_codon:yes stop_codon:yes gene_type:complete
MVMIGRKGKRQVSAMFTFFGFVAVQVIRGSGIVNTAAI